MKMLVLAALAAFATTPALAHAHLVAENPADGAVVSPAPAALTLTFSEGVQGAFTGVVITGPDKAEVKPGTPSLAPDGTVLTVPLDAALAPGAYTIAWHAVGSDGHKTTGSYGFTVK
jgi:methionine-rich copper-binding protein CopC